MSKEMTLTQASEKACQLASLLSAVSANRFDGVASIDGENLVDLAGDLAGGLAVFLLELSEGQSQQAADTHQKTSQDLNRLRATITDIDCLSQQAFSEIAAAADLLLHWMESPKGYQRPGVIAAALSSISYKAQQTLENIGYEAESVGCEYVDLDSKRRFAALEAFKAGVNHA